MSAIAREAAALIQSQRWSAIATLDEGRPLASMVAYAIDADGDVYVRGEVPTSALEAEYLDQLFGVILAASDEAFNELLALGFLGSMKKEWAWRVSRGESTRNLEAFRHLLDESADG